MEVRVISLGMGAFEARTKLRTGYTMSTISSNTGLPLPGVSVQRSLSASTNGVKPETATPVAPVASAPPVQQVQESAKARPSKEQPTNEQVQRISEELQRRVNTVAPELQFSVDHDSGQSVMTLTNPTTKEIIRQFPSEETLKIGKELDRFQKGLVINRKA